MGRGCSCYAKVVPCIDEVITRRNSEKHSTTSSDDNESCKSKENESLRLEKAMNSIDGCEYFPKKELEELCDVKNGIVKNRRCRVKKFELNKPFSYKTPDSKFKIEYLEDGVNEIITEAKADNHKLESILPNILDKEKKKLADMDEKMEGTDRKIFELGHNDERNSEHLLVIKHTMEQLKNTKDYSKINGKIVLLKLLITSMENKNFDSEKEEKIANKLFSYITKQTKNEKVNINFQNY